MVPGTCTDEKTQEKKMMVVIERGSSAGFSRVSVLLLCIEDAAKSESGLRGSHSVCGYPVESGLEAPQDDFL